MSIIIHTLELDIDDQQYEVRVYRSDKWIVARAFRRGMPAPPFWFVDIETALVMPQCGWGDATEWLVRQVKKSLS